MLDHPIAETNQELSIEARSRFQTFRRSFEQICAGESPWIPLGKFMHQFFGEFKAYRKELLQDPLVIPPGVTTEQFQWAVFCAASAEYLCTEYGLDCPEWAHEPEYTLSEPWYHGIGAAREHVQANLRMTTPEAFARRNVYCGDRVFNNKYEKDKRRRTA